MGQMVHRPDPDAGGLPAVHRPAAYAPLPEEGIDLRRTVTAVYRRRRILFITFVTALAAAVIGALALPRTFIARTSVIVQPAGDGTEPAHVRAGDADLVQSQVDTLEEFIRSRNFMEPTLKGLGLLDDTQTPTQRERTIRAIQLTLRARPTGASTFEVTYAGQDPVWPVRIVDAVVSSFITINSRNRAQQAAEAVAYLEREMAQYRRRMEDSRRAVERFQVTNATALAQIPEAASGRRVHVEDGLVEAQMSAVEAQMKRDLIRKQLQSTPATIKADITEIINPRVAAFESRLSTAEAEYQALRSRYTDEHPEVRAKVRELENLRRQLAEAQKEPTRVGSQTTRVNAAYERLQDELRVAQSQLQTAQAREQQLRGMLGSARSTATTAPVIRQRLEQLEAEARTQSALYNSLVERLEQARIAHQMTSRQQEAMFQLIDPARLVPGGDGTRRLAIVLAGAVVGLVLGLTLVGIQETTDRRVRSVEELERAVGVPVLAAIPLLPEMPHHVAARRRWRMMAVKGVVAAVLVGLLFLLGARTRAGQGFIRERGGVPAAAPARQPAAPTQAPAARPTRSRHAAAQGGPVVGQE